MAHVTQERDISLYARKWIFGMWSDVVCKVGTNAIKEQFYHDQLRKKDVDDNSNHGMKITHF